jgi:UDP-N-acetyl-D-glucosamine dehydrogenase
MDLAFAESTKRVERKPFAELITSREARIGIIGLGYTGFPLAVAFAETGFPVTGIDIDRERVRAIAERRSYLIDVPPEKYDRLNGSLRATDDYAAVADLDAVTVCVPTPLAKSFTPDISYVVAAAEGLARHLQPGQLIVLQSTTYPGTTAELIKPILERSGGVVGHDFYLGYAPERIDPGSKRYTLANTPKLVAGISAECSARTELLYRQVVDQVIPVSSTAVAETAKLHENTFRAVNIALANELALICDHLGISAWEVIEAASSKPFGFMPHYPGPGLGGDCIPVVPHFLAWRAREYGYTPQLIEAAHEVNAQMPLFVLQKVTDALNEIGLPVKNSRLLLLGMSYKANVPDIRESPSLEILRQLLARGARVRYCDPLVPEVEVDGIVHRSVEWSDDVLTDADCVVMLAPHRQFLDGTPWERARMVLDTRNAVPGGSNVKLI